MNASPDTRQLLRAVGCFPAGDHLTRLAVHLAFRVEPIAFLITGSKSAPLSWATSGHRSPLGALADIRVVSGPPMIKDEDGVLMGYVFADVDGLQCLPCALAGSVWLLALLDYKLSTAVWVGLIAVGGVASRTGIIAVVYSDQSFDGWRAQGFLRSLRDVDGAVLEGGSKCLRPMLVTVATTVLGLMPLLFASGIGTDLSARTAAPVVGDLAWCMFLTLLVVPAAYAIWRRHGFGRDTQSAAT